MMNILKQLKEYWFLIIFVFGGVIGIVKVMTNDVVGGIALDTVKGAESTLYIDDLITKRLEEAKIPDGAEVHGKLELHGAQIQGNKEDIVLTQTQLQDVARILMRPPQ
jgi:hypothetical protein